MANSSCRKEFTSELLQHALKDENIFTIATDSRGSVTSDKFFDELPEQSAELGIAEQNAVAFAAGLALTGKNVFVTGPACFLAARSFEQIKVDVAYNETNVKIIGVSGGVSYGPLGGTHTSLHDIASMRALPNIEIFIPSDGHQTRAITNYMATKNGPVYMRTGRGDVPDVYSQNEKFNIKKAKIVQNGADVTIIACGEMVYYAKCAGAILADQGISARVIDMFCIKPVDEAAIYDAICETKAIVTVEEHSIYGGLGELVAHVASQSGNVRVKIMGFPDEEYKVGKNNELFEYYGLTAENIAKTAKEILEEN